MTHFSPISLHLTLKHSHPAESSKRVASVNFFTVVHFQDFACPNIQKGSCFHKIENIDKA
jgi:hypothetical protein